MQSRFKLIVAIICAALGLRYSIFRSHGSLAIVIPATAWLIYRARRDWRR
jgi:hypothetical protein